MSTESGVNGARQPASVGQLREQVARDRRELAETVTALHDKTDVKRRVRNKAAGAEVAVADLTARAGRMAGSVPRLIRWAGTAGSERVHKSRETVRAPVERAAGLVNGRVRAILALVTAIIAVMAVWRRYSR